MWVGAKFWRNERDFSPPCQGGDTEGGHEITAGRLMTRFAPSTGKSERDSSRALHFARGSCASFLVPTKSLYHVGIPSEPRQEKKE